MSAARPGPERLGAVLESFLRESDVGERVAQATAVPEWADRVGPGIAAVTTPLRVSRGTLLVGVRSSAWIMELRLIERDILERLNAGRAEGRIERVKFVMSDG